MYRSRRSRRQSTHAAISQVHAWKESTLIEWRQWWLRESVDQSDYVTIVWMDTQPVDASNVEAAIRWRVLERCYS